MRQVDHWPLSPGEFIEDSAGGWVFRCPDCQGIYHYTGDLAPSDYYYFRCLLCGHTTEFMRDKEWSV